MLSAVDGSGMRRWVGGAGPGGVMMESSTWGLRCHGMGVPPASRQWQQDACTLPLGKPFLEFFVLESPDGSHLDPPVYWVDLPIL